MFLTASLSKSGVFGLLISAWRPHYIFIVGVSRLHVALGAPLYEAIHILKRNGRETFGLSPAPVLLQLTAAVPCVMSGRLPLTFSLPLRPKQGGGSSRGDHVGVRVASGTEHE